MARKVKRSKNSSQVFSSGQPSSSLCGDPCSSLTAFNDNKTELCVLLICPAEQVFGIDWIREEILNYAISDHKQNLSINVIKNVRLVQKSWLLTTSKLLKNKEQPVIEIALTHINTLSNVNDEQKTEKLLNRFTETFTTTQAIADTAIPFKLYLDVGFFWEENYKSLVDCMTRLGPYLYEFEIAYPEDGGTLPVNLPHLNFPSLRKLSFQFSDQKLLQTDESDDDDDIITFGNNARGIWLLQSIFNAAENLKHFLSPYTGHDVEIPKDFQFLRLPPTFTELDLDLKLKSKDLSVLLNNDLPNLKSLKLLLHEAPLEDDLLHDILERVQTTLTSFHIKGLQSDGNPSERTYLRFPIMKQLEDIDIDSEECELGPGEVLDLNECLPKLKSLTINAQSKIAFKKWIKNSHFNYVKDLNISLIDEYVKEGDFNKLISLDAELVKGIHTVFPNISELYIYFNVSNITGLNCVFQNMIKLVTLGIYLEGSLGDYCSNLFDSKVLRLPARVVTALKVHGDIFENIEFKSSNETSIRNLSGLTKLVLWTAPKSVDEKESLLSEVMIKYGLLKMPKLQSLDLYGQFKPSPDISKLWEDSGRSMEYQLE